MRRRENFKIERQRLSVEDWLRYGSPESLSLFMYSQPKRAKRLYFDVIPKTVDEYYQHLGKLVIQSEAEIFENPIWHIHSGVPDQSGLPVSFTLLLNLAAVCHAEDPKIVWAYVTEYIGDISPQTHGETGPDDWLCSELLSGYGAPA